MEQVGGLVPMNPHATEIVAQEVVEWVAGKETQAVWDPVSLFRVIVEIGFRFLAQFADRFCTLVVRAGPYSQGDTIEGVRGILLQNEGMMDAVRLVLAGADLYIVREACLLRPVSFSHPSILPDSGDFRKTYPHGRMQGFGDFIILFQTGAASQDLRQPKLAHGSFHVTNLSLRWRGSPDPLGRFPTNTANHVGMSEGFGGSLRSFRIGLRRDGLRNAGVK